MTTQSEADSSIISTLLSIVGILMREAEEDQRVFDISELVDGANADATMIFGPVQGINAEGDGPSVRIVVMPRPAYEGRRTNGDKPS